MVGHNDEKSVVIPRLRRSGGEELAQSHIAVVHAFQNGMVALAELAFIFFGDGVGVVRRDGENASKERLRGACQLQSHIMQEVLVEYAPRAVIVGLVAKLVAAIIGIKAYLLAESVEAHRTVVGSVEESGVVAVLLQQHRQSDDVVFLVVRHQYRAVHQRGQRCHHAGNRFNRLLAVGASLEEQALACQ